MFRKFLNQNLTSLCKPLRSLILFRVRKYSSGCPCPEPPRPPPPPPNCNKVKVTICGANGQVGSIIAFLLKQSPLVDIISLYDLDCTYGMAMDLSHIDTKCRVQSYSGCEDLYECMCESQIVIFCAGVGRAPGMSLNDLFEYNAPVVKQLTEAVIAVNPTALVAVLTNPINSFVPMVSQIFNSCREEGTETDYGLGGQPQIGPSVLSGKSYQVKFADWTVGNGVQEIKDSSHLKSSSYENACCYDSRKIFGITAIDTMRASSIVTNDVLKGSADPAEFLVPVIGGHSPETMVPVLSQTSPCMEIPNTSFDYLIDKIRCAACLVTTLKHRGGPRLSVGLGAARFINNLIRGLRNERDVIELAYVYSNLVPGVCYFASPIELGPCGIKHNLGLVKVDEELEKPHLTEAIKYLKYEIRRGESYIPCVPDPCAS